VIIGSIHRIVKRKHRKLCCDYHIIHSIWNRAHHQAYTGYLQSWLTMKFCRLCGCVP